MKKFVFLFVMIGMVLITSCRQKKHDLAYYEQMVDSIRKAEQVKEIRQKAGITDDDPLDVFFQKLSYRPLPIQSQGPNWEKLGEFTKIPRPLNDCFGYLSEAELSALALPKAGHYPVVMLLEMVDSISPVLYLYTMDRHHQTVDQMCIYEECSEEREADFGKTKLEYFITSNYEISIMKYYQSHDESKKPELENARRYIINKEGKFEEIIIEL